MGKKVFFQRAINTPLSVFCEIRRCLLDDPSPNPLEDHMFLSVATTLQPASDLGFLLHKHPDRLHEIELPAGKALVTMQLLGDQRR